MERGSLPPQIKQAAETIGLIAQTWMDMIRDGRLSLDPEPAAAEEGYAPYRDSDPSPQSKLAISTMLQTATGVYFTLMAGSGGEGRPGVPLRSPRPGGGTSPPGPEVEVGKVHFPAQRSPDGTTLLLPSAYRINGQLHDAVGIRMVTGLSGICRFQLTAEGVQFFEDQLGRARLRGMVDGFDRVTVMFSEMLNLLGPIPPDFLAQYIVDGDIELVGELVESHNPPRR